MKRIIYSSLFVILTLLSKSVFSQASSFTLSSPAICYNPAPASMTVGIGIVAQTAGATSYSWTAAPTSSGCVNFSVTPVAINGSLAVMTLSCCGVYQINMYAYNQFGVINNLAQSFTVECPSNGSIAIPSQTICRGNSTNITALGAATYTWIASASGGGATTAVNPISVSPTVNSTYTVYPLTANGCTLNPITATVAVQAATITASPATINACAGSTIALSSSVAAVNGTNVSAGTVTTGIQWLAPPAPGTGVGSTRNVTVNASQGTYSAVLTHTGAAGTCTLFASVLVNTTTTMPLTVTASPSLVCPGNNVTLSGSTGTVPTSSSGYTWTAVPAMFPPNVVGNPIVKAPTVNTVYSVSASYFGCTASGTVAVTMNTITPSIATSVANSCPGRSLTITAGGAINYTFTAVTVGSTVLTTASSTINTVNHSPTLSNLNFPIQYCVSGYSFGCVGSACTTVGLLALTPTLSSLTGSDVCPGTSVTLSSTGGAGTTYTFIAFPVGGPLVNPLPGSNTLSTRPYTPPGNNIGFYPLTFTVNVDSAGCKGTANLSLGVKTINTIITPSSPDVCLETQFTLTASGGAGTTYTWTAPSPITSPALVSSGNQATHSSSVLTGGSTYTVEVDSAGCKGSGQITITERVISPQFTVSPASGSICAGSAVCFTASGGAGTTYTFVAPYAISPPSTVNIIPTIDPTVNVACTTPPNPGTFPFTFTLSVDSGGCHGGSTKTIGLFVIPPQHLTLASKPASVCPNSTLTLKATSVNSLSAFNYTFIAPPNTATATNSTDSLLVLAPSAASLFPLTYVVVADSSDGLGGSCVVTNSVSVNLLFLKNVSLAASPPFVCAGQPSTLTATFNSTNTSLYNCIFAPISPTGTPFGPSFTNSVVFSPTITTIYALSVDSAGCQTPSVPVITTSITIIPALSFTPVASSSSVCAGLASTITITSAPTTTYTWFQPLGSGTIAVGAAPSASAVVNPTTSSIYTVSAVDNIGCVGTATVKVDIDPAAHITLTLSSNGTTICPGQSVTLTAVADINPSTFSWSPTAGLSSTTGSAVISTPSLTTVYTATANNGYGCVGNSNYTVLVGTWPTLMVTPTASAVCVGFTSTLTGNGAGSYTWTGTTFSGSIAQPSISVPPGTYSLTGSNGGTCIDSSYVFTVGLAPNLTITHSQTSNTTCITTNYPKLAKPVNLTANGAATYAWSAYDPATMTYSLGANTTVRPHATTCYTVTGATSICSGSAIVCVTVIPQFTMAVTPPLPAMCLGDSLKLSIVNVGTLAVGPASQFGYNWADPQPISVYNPLASTVIATPQTNATYSVEVTDARSCISVPRLVTVTVFPRPITAIAIPTINSVPTNTVCYVGNIPGPPDNVITLTGINANVGLQFGVVPTYTWVSPFNPSSILTPVNNNVVTVNAPKRLLNNTSVVVYTLQSGYNGIPGCARYDTVSIRVIDCRPVSAVTHSLMFNTAEKNDTLCARQCITFINQTDTAAGGPQIYDWRFSGGSPATSTVSAPTVCYNLPGKYNVILTVTNPYPKADGGSTITGGQLNYVKVVDIPNVTIVAPGQLASDTTVRFGQTVSLTGTNALTYIWSPAYNISSLTNPKVVVNPFKTTQYILKGFNSAGCYSTDTLNVHVIEDCGEMYVPNAFSPNNDGHNDVLYVRGICLQTLTFMVFNRWGEKVFETVDQKIGWDGKYRGEDMNTGIFVYRLEGKTYDGKGFSTKGNITLIR